MIKWYFPYSNNVNRKGLSDSGIETFKGQLLESLTREIVQNALDAKVPDKDFVSIEFEYFYVKTSRFPDKEGFISNLKASYDTGKLLKDSKTSDFFDNALKLFEKADIPFLRISDYNTTGLTGSKVRGSNNWHNLVKSTGISDKGQSAGGSFGIGKNAPFACSSLHTVFYSTLDSEGIEAYQGVSNLISVDKEDKSDFTQGIGQLSITEKLEPIFEQFIIQPNYKRVVSGTDIYIAGFSFSKDEFKIGILKGIINNFLYAVFKETLEVKIDSLLIKKDTLEKIIQLNKSVLDIESVELYEVLTSKETKWYDDFQNGQAILGLSLAHEGSRKVSAIRKPWMKIQTLNRFSKGIEFKGAFIVVGESLNKLLRKMENPQHDKWETDRLDINSRNTGVKTLKDINKYINEKVQNLVSIDMDDVHEVYGASDYITLVEDEKTKKGRVKESIKKVEVKKNNPTISPHSVYDYGIADAIIDADGEVPEFDVVIKSGQMKQKQNLEADKKTDKRGRHVSIQQNQIKLVRNYRNNKIHLHYTSKNEISSVNFVIHALDEEGNKIRNILEIVEAHQGGIKLPFDENAILNVHLDGSICNITFETNIKESLGLAVDVYENS